MGHCLFFALRGHRPKLLRQILAPQRCSSLKYMVPNTNN